MFRRNDRQEVSIKPRRGRPLSGGTPEKKALIRLYVIEGKSIREIAGELRCSKDMVSRALKSYKIEARPNIKRSRLRKLGKKALKSAAEKKGIRGAARELGVSPSTLCRFLGSEGKK